MLSRADKLLITVLFLLAIGGIIPNLSSISAHHQVAEIRVDGKLIRTVELRQGYRETIHIGESHHYNDIEIADGRIRIIDADCPDQICVQTGWISIPAQQIVCLPWRVAIKIVPSKSQNIDAVVR